MRYPSNGQHEGRVRPLHYFLEGQHHAPRPVEFEIGGGGCAVFLQETAEEAHETGTKLYQFQTTVYHEVPREGLTEGGNAHLEAVHGARRSSFEFCAGVKGGFCLVGEDCVPEIEFSKLIYDEIEILC